MSNPLPEWFGPNEFYIIIITIWFFIIAWVLVNLIKTKADLKGVIPKFKAWRKERKKKKDEKIL